MSRLEKEALTFLVALSELAGGRAGASVATSAVMAWPGFDQAATLLVIEELAGERLITGNTSRVALTAAGAGLVPALARSMDRFARLLALTPQRDRPADFA